MTSENNKVVGRGEEEAPALDASSRVSVSPSVYVRAFGTELVLLDFSRGEYFGLDEVAADIWRRLEAGDSLGAIANAIVKQYDVADDVAFQDIRDLVTQLRDHSLITVTHDERP